MEGGRAGVEVPEAERYDVVVVGAGPGGEVAADRLVQAGLSVVVVEAESVGGECSYRACIPSKALLRPAAVLREARSVRGAEQVVYGPPQPAAVLRRRDAFTSGGDDSGQAAWLAGARIGLVRGWGRLTGERTVEVKEPDGSVRVLAARHAVVLGPGSAAALPDVRGLEGAGVWTSREATTATTVPERLAVVGGGVVACEMATAWSGLGSEVTLLVRGERLLAGWEPFVGDEVAGGLTDLGVTLRFGVRVRAVDRGPMGMAVELDDGGVLECDELLVATGRRPRTDDLGLESVGLRPGGVIPVDDTCAVTTVPGGWLYAVGDANGRSALTHMAKYQARICAAAIVARAAGSPAAPGGWSAWSADADRTAVPRAVFTHPEAASVGLTERAARAAGLRVRTVGYGIGDVAGAALHADGYRGTAKLVVDEDRGVVVGCSMTGQGTTELIHAATVAIVGEVPLARLWHAVPAFPTVSEVWLRLLEAYGL